MNVVYGLLVVGGACFVAVLGLALVQRLVPTTIRKGTTTWPASSTPSCWRSWSSQRGKNSGVPALRWKPRPTRWPRSSCSHISSLNPKGEEAQELCRSYAEEVVNVGWPLMEQGRTPSMEHSQESSRAWVLIDDIRASLQEVEPRTVAGQALRRRARPGPAAGGRQEDAPGRGR